MTRGREAQEVQQLNVRVPRDVYEALRTYAYATNSTLKDAAVCALVDLLSEQDVKRSGCVSEARRKAWRVDLDKLADL